MTHHGLIDSQPVLHKTIDADGVKVTIHFKEQSNPQALFLLKKNLISSIIRQINDKSEPN